jgi:hypothetical protein
MKETRLPIPQRDAVEIPWADIVTENYFDIDGTLPGNQAVLLENVDLFQGHIKTRESVRLFNSQARSVSGAVVSQISWIPEEAQDKEFLINQTGTGIEYRDVNDVGSAWTRVYWYNFYTDVAQSPVATIGTSRMVLASDKVYMFAPGGNAVFEYDPGDGLIKARPVGMGRPAITDWPAGLGVGKLDPGKYQYAVEYCYRKNIGTDAEADYITSTPQRRFKVGVNTLGDYVVRTVVNLGDTVVIEAETLDAAADDLWTHIKLYRSRNLEATSATDTVIGSPDRLYAIQLVDRATFIANSNAFAEDTLSDDQLPAIEAGAETVIFSAQAPDMDQEALPDGIMGVWHNNRIWTTGLLNNEKNSKTQLYYTSATSFKYSEQWSATQVYECSVGDGQSITDLVSFEEDLIVFKQAQTGRVPSGNPGIFYDKLDSSIGVPDRAFFVPQVGIVGLTNNLEEAMIFGYGLRWSNTFNGVPFSKPTRGIFTATNPGIPSSAALTGVAYFKGKILMSIGTRIFAFHATEGLGWSSYDLSYINGGDIESLHSNTLGDQCFISIAGEYRVLGFYDRDLDDWTLAGNVTIKQRLTTIGFQSQGGRGIIEQRYISLMAKVLNIPKMSAAYSIRQNEQKSSEVFALDPSEANFDVPIGASAYQYAAMAEYQYYAKHNHPYRTRIYGDRIFYTLEIEGYMEFKDLKFVGYEYVGVRPPWITTKGQQEVNTGILAELSTDQLHWQTRPDMAQDRVNPNDPSKPFQEINFIVGKPE